MTAERRIKGWLVVRVLQCRGLNNGTSLLTIKLQEKDAHVLSSALCQTGAAAAAAGWVCTVSLDDASKSTCTAYSDDGSPVFNTDCKFRVKNVSDGLGAHMRIHAHAPWDSLLAASSTICLILSSKLLTCSVRCSDYDSNHSCGLEHVYELKACTLLIASYN
jgi:hypothetical protein